MITNEVDLIEVIRNEKNIIIYGAKSRAEMLLERLRMNGITDNIFVAVSNLYGEPLKVSDIHVREIHTLTDLRKDCTVIIAAQPKFQEEMQETLKKYGFQKVILMNELLWDSIRTHFTIQSIDNRVDELKRELKFQRFLQQQTINLIRLNRLQDKVKNGHRVKVIFLVTTEAKFFYESVYRAMEKNKLFDVSIFILDEFAYEYRSEPGQNMRRFADKLQEKGYNVIWGYDDNNMPLPIEMFSPDIVFYCTPYLKYRNADQLISRIILNICPVTYHMDSKYQMNLFIILKMTIYCRHGFILSAYRKNTKCVQIGL